ncbi:MAG: hypothetical protein GY929_10195, partial [Actinomycetia bacterium]|nr:hypothetical protein [Actinomycetes bacterium]
MTGLARDQLRVFEVLVDLIEAGSHDLPPASEWRKDLTAQPGFDEDRTSRVIFLGGDRGSGKTTVARTLLSELAWRSPFDGTAAKRLAELEREVRVLKGSPGPAGEDNPKSGADEDTSGQREQLEKIGAKLDKLTRKVILLEALGMENAPAETNILAALLSRIEQELFPDLGQEDAFGTTGQPQQHEAVLELLRLQTDVAIAWNGNLGDRKGNLDPDNYAMEELRVERVRLQLRDRFEAVLRRTARDSLGRPEPAMFLLVVDDVDLNPDQILNLVDRLRMVGVAELLVILIGDLQVMETVFRLHFAKRYALGGAPGATRIGMKADDLSAMTNGLAQAALRKHVPYHQRIQLKRLTPADALKVTPLHGGVELRVLLHEVKVAWPPQIAAAGGQLGGPVSPEELPLTPLEAFIHPTMSGAEGLTSWYSGSRLLSDFPRPLIDVWNALFDAQHRHELDTKTSRAEGTLDRRLLKLIAEIALERLIASTALLEWQREELDAGLREMISEEGDLSALNIRAEHTVSLTDQDRWAGLATLPGDDSDTAVHTLIWSKHHGIRYYAFAGTRSSAGKPEEVTMTEDQAGALVLVEDLWATQALAPSSESTSHRHRVQLQWVVEA